MQHDTTTCNMIQQHTTRWSNGTNFFFTTNVACCCMKSWDRLTGALLCAAAGPDLIPIGGGQLPTNPNECNHATRGIYPYPYIYTDVDERGHCPRLGSPLTFFPLPRHLDLE